MCLLNKMQKRLKVLNYLFVHTKMKVSFYYGIIENNIDVSEKCNGLIKNNYLFISRNQFQRDQLFSDPVVGRDKFLFIHIGNNIQCFSNTQDVYLKVGEPRAFDQDCVSYDYVQHTRDTEGCLNWIRGKLQIDYGDFSEEFVEQRLAVKYLTGHEKILEIGGNIGRCALIISFILNSYDNTDFVSMECNTDIAKQLIHNRDKNNAIFHIEPTALSKRKIIQNGWHNVESDVMLENHLPVKNISCVELKEKYRIQFDTLIIDCEEAFYVILQDIPEILDGINLIIMENDYLEQKKKDFVDNILNERNFHVVYSEKGHWPEEHNRFPCYQNFYEVWKYKLI